MKTPHLLPLFAGILFCSPPLQGQDSDRPNPETERQTEQARRSKEEGRLEKGEKRAQKEQAESGEKKGKKEVKEERGDQDHGDRFSRMKRESGEGFGGGKHEEAERRDRQHKEGSGREEGEKRQADKKGDPRLHHLREAIQHLRAAGLKEPAENLENVARRMRDEPEHRVDRKPVEKQQREKPQAESSDEVRRLREQAQKLFQEVERFRKELNSVREE